MHWINRNVPIEKVAQKLGLRFGEHGRIHCWHPDCHSNGDRTPSVGIRKTNNTVKCFGCGCNVGPFGPISFVMDVLTINAGAAALWIAEEFSVPTIPKGRHLREPKLRIARAGFEGELGILIYSGIWSRLSLPAQSVAAVLLHLSDREPGKPRPPLIISYRAISRYTGLVSHSSIANAIEQLEEIGWLARRRSEQLGGPFRPVSRYLLTPESDSLRELANVTVKQQRDEIQAEKELRRQIRSERFRLLRQQRESQTSDRSTPDPNRPTFTMYDSLYPSKSVDRNHAISGTPHFENGCLRR